MKKMVFSAVALVAFSFAGVANNEGKEFDENFTIRACWECGLGAFIEKYSPCFAAVSGVTHTLQQYGIEEHIIEEAAADAFNSCANDIDG